MLPLRLLRQRLFTVSNTAMVVVGFALMGSSFFFSQFFVYVQGSSVLRAGLQTLPVSVAMVIVSPYAGRLAAGSGFRVVVTTGLALAGLGLLALVRPRPPGPSAAAIAAGSTATTWSYSRPLTTLAGTTATRAPSASGPAAAMPAASRAARSPGTSGSAATTPTEPSRASACRTASTTVSGTAPGAHPRSVSSPSPRSERAAGTSTSSRSSSRLVRPTTFFGTRNPVVSGTTAASGRPRWARTVRQDRAAHGVVPWARSPRTVSEPKADLRAMARHSIGERSWASSTTMWP
ncbi:hypothetical protein SVIOM342S_01572 [Streptomyces violaceorubidus]